MIALDTNLLVYAHRSGYAEHRAARQAVERAARDPRGWGIPLPCISEFWNVATHPQAQGGGSPPPRARDFLWALTEEAGAQVWMPREGFWERLTKIAQDLGVRGPRIFDLQIGLIAFENGVTEIWTHDRSFFPLPGLTILDPM